MFVLIFAPELGLILAVVRFVDYQADHIMGYSSLHPKKIKKFSFLGKRNCGLSNVKSYQIRFDYMIKL